MFIFQGKNYSRAGVVLSAMRAQTMPLPRTQPLSTYMCKNGFFPFLVFPLASFFMRGVFAFSAFRQIIVSEANPMTLINWPFLLTNRLWGPSTFLARILRLCLLLHTRDLVCNFPQLSCFLTRTTRFDFELLWICPGVKILGGLCILWRLN